VATPLVLVTPDALDVARLAETVASTSHGDGAVVTFVGLVRDHNQGRTVRFLEYEAYEELEVRTIEGILQESRDA
jgi:molybdopterin synthase catalytic subunit